MRLSDGRIFDIPKDNLKQTISQGGFKKLDDMVAPIDRLALAEKIPVLVGCPFCGGKHSKEKHG